MDFRGLNVGPGLSQFGELMQKGMQDRIELARQHEYDQMAAQKANMETGFGNENPEAYGINMVPSPDLSSLGMGASQAPASPAPYTPPDLSRTPAAMAPNSPMMSSAGTTPGQAPLPQMGEDVDQNALKNNVYQQTLQHLGTIMPGTNSKDSSLTTPFNHHVAMQVAEQAAKIQQAQLNSDKYIQGRNDDASVRAQGLIDAQKIRNQGAQDRADNKPNSDDQLNNKMILKLMDEQKGLADPRVSPVYRRQRTQEISSQLSQLGAPGSAPAQSAPQANGDDSIWSNYQSQHPSVKDTPENRAKVIKALKGQ